MALESIVIVIIVALWCLLLFFDDIPREIKKEIGSPFRRVDGPCYSSPRGHQGNPENERFYAERVERIRREREMVKLYKERMKNAER